RAHPADLQRVLVRRQPGGRDAHADRPEPAPGGPADRVRPPLPGRRLAAAHGRLGPVARRARQPRLRPVARPPRPVKRVLAIGAVLLAASVLVVFATGASTDPRRTYRVRAIFENAFSVIPGEDVKVAGVKDFRRDAECTIRPQSLIGEKFVECTPTQPRPDGAPAPPPLRRITRGEGRGQYLLPVSQTSRPVDLDL